jgi:predicted DNA-binding transcriptional regulator AlpA
MRAFSSATPLTPVAGKRRPPRTNSAEALANFDSLPDAAYVRQPVVEALFGVSSATVWRMVGSGRVPRPIKTGPRATAWNVGELRRALAAMRKSAEG